MWLCELVDFFSSHPLVVVHSFVVENRPNNTTADRQTERESGTTKQIACPLPRATKHIIVIVIIIIGLLVQVLCV